MGTVSTALIGGAVGYYVGKHGDVNTGVVKLASRAIDLYVEAKWMLVGLISPTDKDKAEAAEEIQIKWHAETEHYKIYELQGKVYITFNADYKPVLHLEDDSIDEVSVILKNGKRAAPSDRLIELLTKCAGHGCSYKSGVPTLDQLRLLPDEILGEVKEELSQVKKIIINTVQFEEHILEEDEQVTKM